MRVPIVLLSGPAGSGKDTVAGLLAKHTGAATLAMADPMKALVRDLFGFTDDQLSGPSARRSEAVFAPDDLPDRFAAHAPPWLLALGLDPDGDQAARLSQWAHTVVNELGQITARHALQTLGTEWGRALDPDLWVNAALRRARELLLGGAPAAIITDGRFRNEILATHVAGGHVVRIRCPGAGLTGAAATHASEQEQVQIPDSWFDLVLYNDRSAGLPALERAVASTLRYAVLPGGAPVYV